MSYVTSIGGFINTDWSKTFVDSTAGQTSLYKKYSTARGDESITYDKVDNSTLNFGINNPPFFSSNYNSEIKGGPSSYSGYMEGSILPGKSGGPTQKTSYLESLRLNQITVYDTFGNGVSYTDFDGNIWYLVADLSTTSSTNPDNDKKNLNSSNNSCKYSSNSVTIYLYGVDSNGLSQNYDLYAKDSTGNSYCIYQSSQNSNEVFSLDLTSVNFKLNAINAYTVTTGANEGKSGTNHNLNTYAMQCLYYNGFILPLAGVDGTESVDTSTATGRTGVDKDGNALSSDIKISLGSHNPSIVPNNLSSDPTGALKNIFTNPDTKATFTIDTKDTYGADYLANSYSYLHTLQKTGFITAGYIIINSTSVKSTST